jgi:hypothetical protein
MTEVIVNWNYVRTTVGGLNRPRRFLSLLQNISTATEKCGRTIKIKMSLVIGRLIRPKVRQNEFHKYFAYRFELNPALNPKLFSWYFFTKTRFFNVV